MVLRQIGEDRHVERDTRDSMQSQRVGGDLHHHGAVARIHHVGHQLLEIGRLGSGVLDCAVLISHSGSDGANQTGSLIGFAQDGLAKEGGRGLAVSPGDTHRRQSGGGVVEGVPTGIERRPP